MNLNHRINQIKYYFNRYGFWKTLLKCIKRIFGIKDKALYTDKEAYQMWIENNEPKLSELNELRKKRFEIQPLISIVVPMYNTSEKYFEELIQSVISQTYPHWELCLADGSLEKNNNLEEIAQKDNRIFYKFLGENKGISGNTNEALKLANGEYIVLLDHDDLLSVTALYEIVKTINEENDVDFIYSDEDKITDSGERFEPYFKPDFSPETLSVHNYITHLVCFKKSLQEEVGFFNDEFDGAQDFDMILRLTEKAQKVVHISKILYHWRAGEGSTALLAENKPYAYEAGRLAVEAHIKRLGRSGIVEDSKEVPGIYKIKYDVIGNPKVSILIPNKDGINYLRPCINSILKLTTYENYEIVIIENNSEKESTFKYYEEVKKNPKIRVLEYKEKEFNYSRIINFGVKNVDGDFVVQLNNDTKLISKDWLETFIGYCQFKEIGACRRKTLL